MRYRTRAGYNASTLTSESSETSASSEASGPRIFTSASAGPGYLKTKASADSVPAIWNPQGGAFATQSYNILGNLSNEPLPLNFNFEFTGSISAKSQPSLSARTNIGYSAITLGLTSRTLSPRSTERYRGQASVRVVNGIPEYRSSGVFGEGEISVNIETNFGFNILGFLDDGNVIDELLTEEMIKELGIDESLSLAIDLGDFSSARLAIINALNLAPDVIKLIFPGSGVAESLNFIDLSIDVDYVFEDTISIPVKTSNSGSISSSLISSVRTVGDASGVSDFSQSLTLHSVTVPAEYSLENLDNPRIVFDSGIIFPIISEDDEVFPSPFFDSPTDNDITLDYLELEDNMLLDPIESIGIEQVESMELSDLDLGLWEASNIFSEDFFPILEKNIQLDTLIMKDLWETFSSNLQWEDIEISDLYSDGNLIPYFPINYLCGESAIIKDLIFFPENIFNS